MKNSLDVLSPFYPEVQISGFTSTDGTIEFYHRINSLLSSDLTVLDFGAGRAAWHEDDPCSYRKELRTIKGKVRKFVGCDVDSAILDNNSVDERVQIEIGKALPFPDDAFHLIISDFTFEHIDNPGEVAGEFRRILKKGGWICARTPNKYSYISLLTRMVRNVSHARLLKFAQPGRKEIDVFPTIFKLNSLRNIGKYFPEQEFDNFTYRFESEPAYHFNSKLILSFFLLANRLQPPAMKGNLMVFLRKR